MEQNKKTTIDLLEAQSQTPLAIVNKIFLSGNFAPAPNEAIKENEGEVVIGELTDYEKALYSATDSLVDTYNGLPRESRPQTKGLNLKASIESLQELLFASIRNRLGKITYDGSGIGLKQQYKIVVTPKKPEENMMEELAKSFARDMKIALEHNCDECPTYDECDLPIRKERNASASLN